MIQSDGREKQLLVIIVTYNAMLWADRCFGSLRKSSVHSEVFVVDNGSTDGTQGYLKKNYPEVIFYQSSENLGFGRANNIGLQYAIDNDYEYVYLLNQDAWVFEDTFQIMISVHLDNKEYGILSPVQIEANMQHLDKNFLTIICGHGRNLVESLLLKKKMCIADNVHTMAAHWLISRECLCDVGGFSPAFRHYGEDGNYLDRATYHGKRYGIVLDAYGVHDRETRMLSIEKQFFFMYNEAIVLASSISRRHPFSGLSFILRSLKAVIRHGSLLPIKYVCLYCLQLKKLNHYRKLSQEKSAFLITANKDL